MMNEIIIGTSNYNTVNQLCAEAQQNSKLITIIGYPGAGKTTALEAYRDSYPNVFYMRVAPSMTAKQFYAGLLNSLGIEGRDVGAGLHDLINQVSFKLNYDNTKKLIIVDEAGKFKPKFMEYLHELRDNTLKTTGIILAGPEYFQENMKAWRNKGVIGIPEFYRRINHWEHLSTPSIEEISTLCKAHEVDDYEFIKEVIATCSNFSEIINEIEAYLIRKRKK
jgi:hypothetical protein